MISLDFEFPNDGFPISSPKDFCDDDPDFKFSNENLKISPDTCKDFCDDDPDFNFSHENLKISPGTSKDFCDDDPDFNFLLDSDSSVDFSDTDPDFKFGFVGNFVVSDFGEFTKDPQSFSLRPIDLREGKILKGEKAFDNRECIPYVDTIDAPWRNLRGQICKWVYHRGYLHYWINPTTVGPLHKGHYRMMGDRSRGYKRKPK